MIVTQQMVWETLNSSYFDYSEYLEYELCYRIAIEDWLEILCGI